MDELSTQSTDCGRISRRFSNVDRVNVYDVGIVKEYSIRAIQANSLGVSYPTNVTTVPYRIPYLVKIHGSVKTASGTGGATACCYI